MLNFGGKLKYKCTWSDIAWPSITSTPFCLHKSLIISHTNLLPELPFRSPREEGFITPDRQSLLGSHQRSWWFNEINYSDLVISQRLDMDTNTLAQTRKELIRIGLIAYQKPLYQVLALDTLIEATNRYPGQFQSLAQIFKQIGEGAP